RTEVLGVGPQATMVWQFRVAAGHFLPADNLSNPRPLAVLGAGLKRELFGSGNPLGASVRIGQDRFRVVGVMEAKGQVLGFDIDNTLYIPAARALALFNREGLMEINLLYRPEAEVQTVESALQRLLAERHGREDFTVISQTQMLQSLAGILAVLTAAVAALGGISLLVGAVGILTIMTIVVTERTPEIGLLRALGAPRRLILGLFLAEAVLLALVGGAAGLLGGGLLAGLLALSVPGLPLHVSLFYALLALLLSFAIGLLAGVLPARQAARLDPVQALRTQ
ncbi:MAG TPA: ABC transporter permease, partial [Candidatus Competibacteraceae bacterium]|nr:ABC transporter permease [Candidatus Competibacteraceae bacterium]